MQVHPAVYPAGPIGRSGRSGREGRILCWNLDRREEEVVVRLHKLVANRFGEYDVMQARRGAVGDEYPIRAC